METLYKTPPSRNTANTRARVRFILTLAGIVAAVLCLFTLLYEVRAAGVTTLSPLNETTERMPVNFVKNTNMSFLSAIWPLK